jgi:hypothetical protein
MDFFLIHAASLAGSCGLEPLDGIVKCTKVEVKRKQFWYKNGKTAAVGKSCFPHRSVTMRGPGLAASISSWVLIISSSTCLSLN